MEAVQDHLACGGFDAWIVVDGAKMPQYGIERKAGEQKASCWISSETDKEFAISFCRNQQEEYDYCVTIKLDGHMVAYNLFRNVDYRNRSSTHTISTVRVSLMEVRKFVFASLELTDDDLHLEDLASQNIGEILVIIQRVKTLYLSHNTPKIYAVPTNAGKVHERSKKVLAHQIRFNSDKETLRPNPTQHSYKTLPHGEPIIFVFKYRPHALLQATGIVPRIPSPLEKESPRRSMPPTDGSKKRKISVIKTEINDDNDESEEEDDLAEERELLAKLERVRNRKRAKKEANAHSKKKVKTEPRTYFTPGEVIDLT